MPSALSYPGVYIEEVPSGVRAIVGVSTSICAFVGRTARGPIDRAVRITDRAGFVRTYGGPHADSDLAASVMQFFDNGGTDCYVVRVANNASAAGITLRNGTGAGSADVLVITAVDKGAAGNDLRLEVDYGTANPEDSFNLRVLEETSRGVTVLESFPGLTMSPGDGRYAGTFITASSTRINASIPTALVPDNEASDPGYSESRRPLLAGVSGLGAELDLILGTGTPDVRGQLQVSVDDGAPVIVDLAAGPLAGFATKAGLEAELTSRFNAALSAGSAVAVTIESAGSLRYLKVAAATTAMRRVRITAAPFRDSAVALMMGTAQGGYEMGRHAKLRPAATATWYSAGPTTLAALKQGDVDALTVDGRPLDLAAGGTSILETTGATDLWWKQSAGADPATGNASGVSERLLLLAKALATVRAEDGTKTFRAEVWGSRLAIVPTTGLPARQIPIASSPEDAFGQGFTQGAHRYALGNASGNPYASAPVVGSDGASAPGVDDFVGDPALASGMYALDPVDLFNLMVVPYDSALGEIGITQVATSATIYCEQRRALFLFDAPKTWTDPATGRPVATSAHVDKLRSVLNGRNTAVYYPHLGYFDGVRTRLIGPSGAVAGVMARTDVERGVWKAPAGTDATVRGIAGLETRLTDREQGILNKAGANVIRAFPAGTVVWGARTLVGTDDVPSEWKYVPIRRFALFLEESLYRGTQWVVFEPNDEPLWASIRKNIRAFMLGLFRQGAFEGSTPDQAFYVKCDRETTTKTDRDLGIVNIEVGFAPLKPAEFVVLRIQQIAND